MSECISRAKMASKYNPDAIEDFDEENEMQIFISYNWTKMMGINLNQKICKRLAERLKERKFKPWFDKKDMEATSDMYKKMAKNI